MGKQSLRIQELVNKIERGEIRLPEMQRQYVWPGTRVRDLLDSLYRGYPSGTILTWETDEKVATRDFAIEQEEGSYATYQLLLDGQQRLTSLSAILRGDPLHVKGRKRPIDILFNLNHPDELSIITEVDESNDVDDAPDASDATEEDIQQRLEKMAFVVKTNRLAQLPHWVSVTEVMNNSSDTEFLKNAGVTGFDDPRYEKYSARLKKLRDIRDYKYGVHVLESYEEVTEIFVRVNSLGAKLRGSDLALAQITATWRDSLAIFQKYQKECAKVGFDLDVGLHVKNLVSFATGQSRFKTVSRLSPDDLQSGWKSGTRGMDFALNYLKSNLGLDSPALLSSPFMIIALAYYVAHQEFELSEEEDRKLRYWVLAANAKGRYSRGSSETYLDQDIGAIRKGRGLDAMTDLLRTQFGRLDILPSDLENRNSRSAYFKMMFLVFREDGAKDWNERLRISLKHKGNSHKLQFHHIFPQDLLKKKGFSTNQINDISNLAFIGGRTNRKISNKNPADYLPLIIQDQGEEAFTKQCIPIDQKLWDLDRYEDFLIARRKLIAQRLDIYLSDYATFETV